MERKGILQTGLVTLLQLGHDGSIEAFRLGGAGPALLNLAVATDEEFLEIPLYPLQPQHPGHLLLHPFVNGLGLVAVHISFAQDGKGDPVIDLAELLDCVVGAGILFIELIAGKAEDDEGVGPVSGRHGLVEFLQPFELRGEATFGGCVDDEHDFVFEIGERVGLAVLCLLASEDVG